METIIKFRDDFRSLLTKLSRYEKLKNDIWWEYLELFDLLIDILIDIYNIKELSEEDKNQILNTFRYLISPLDALPELVFGLDGFKDDLYLVAYVLNKLIQKPECQNIKSLTTNKEVLRKTIAEIVSMGDNYFNPEMKKIIIETINTKEDYILKPLERLNEDCVNSECTKSEPKTNYEQEDLFIHKDGPMMVIAGPGSGKTYTIENKVYNLIINKKIDPSNILVTTFTNKAADELLIRLKEKLKNEDNINEIISNITISTIHAFCYRLIKDFHHEILFLKGTYIPIEENNQLLFLYQNRDKLGLDSLFETWKRIRKEAGDYNYRINTARFYSYILGIYNFVSEEVLNAKEDALCKYFDIIYQPDNLDDMDLKIISTYPKYWKLITKAGKLDQSMVLSYVEALLNDNKILQSIRKQYQYLLIDEYQDINPIQAKIFNKISGSNGNIFVVGDDDQSIYKFRGADVRNITEFSKHYPSAKFAHISNNMRSTQPIVEASKALIEKNKKRIDKPLKSLKKSSIKPIILQCNSDENQITETVKYVQLLKEKQYIDSYSQIAILFRSIKKNKIGQKLYQAFQDNNIPSIMTSDKGLFKQSEIADFVKVLDAISSDRALTVNTKQHDFFKKFKWDKKKTNQYLETIQKELIEVSNNKTGLLDIFSLLSG